MEQEHHFTTPKVVPITHGVMLKAMQQMQSLPDNVFMKRNREVVPDKPEELPDIVA